MSKVKNMFLTIGNGKYYLNLNVEPDYPIDNRNLSFEISKEIYHALKQMRIWIIPKDKKKETKKQRKTSFPSSPSKEGSS